MQFNSVSSSDYSRAAQGVVKNMDSIYNTARETSPDFTGIINTAIEARSKVRQAGMKAESALRRQGMKSAAEVKIAEKEKEMNKDVQDALRPARRMAGIVAGMGTLSQAYVAKKFADEDAKYRDDMKQLRLEEAAFNKQKYEELQGSYQPQIDSLTGRIAEQDELIKKLERERDGIESPEPSAETPNQTAVGKNLQSVVTPNAGPGWGPLGNTLKFIEGTWDNGTPVYNRGFGGATIGSLKQHPNTVFQGVSAAAGAYQFMPDTWKRVSEALGLPDFGPQSQEMAGRQLVKWRGVDPDTAFRTKEEARLGFFKLAPEWAGIPTASGRSFYEGVGPNKATKTMEEILDFYESQLGYKLQ